MMRLVLFLLVVLVLAAGLSWLADRPGSLLITWQGYEIETSFFRAILLGAALLGVTLLGWSLVRHILSGPAVVNRYLTRRRHRRGLDALSAGMIAVGAGDRAMAARYALQAKKSLPYEPLTHLLRAQAAQLSGDKGTARRIFEAMLASPDTEQLGLRGLFLEAGREGEREAQRQFAARALALNPKLAWPVEALFDLECRAGNWMGALETLGSARKHGHVERRIADRRRAVLVAAQAQALEERDPEKALNLALEAHGLAPDLVPAAAIAGRLLASRGNTPRAAKILRRTWSQAPHPDLATAYAYARIGDSPRDRLDRIKQLAALHPYSVESAVATATAAAEARDYAEARRALAPFLEDRLTRRVAVLMARIEGEEHGDKGRVREWLARAVHARRDPAWTADGVVSERWAPVSPVTGALDAFQWRVPVEEIEAGDAVVLNNDIRGLVALVEPGARDVAQGASGQVDDRSAPAVNRHADAAIEGEAIEAVTGRGAGAIGPHTQSSGSNLSPSAELQSPEPVREAKRSSGKRHSGRVESRPAENPPGTAGAKGRHDKRKAGAEPAHEGKPQILTPPHAPDDPGTESGEGEDPVSPLRPFRV